MSILYKYYSSRFDLEDYLKGTPTIRISQTSSLNDPFEGKIARAVIKVITKSVLSDSRIIPKGSEEKNEMTMMEIMNEFISAMGVVSLTETQRNLLMWAHYASEHKGCCIGYKDDLFDDATKIDNSMNFFSYTPIKVNYDTVVFDDELIERLDNIPSKLEDEDYAEIIKKAMSTKSNDWLYEKEHRCILPIEWSDKIVIKSINSLPDYVKKPFEEIKNNNTYKMDIDEQTATIIPIKKKTKTFWSRGSYIGYENQLSRYKETMFLKNISKEKIQSIYLGCNFPKTKERSLIELIKDKKNGLSHISLYRCIISSERFEIKTQKIQL